MPEYHGHFEVHLTARTDDRAAAERFAGWCHGRGLKCVHIVLARGATTDQPMATWRRSATALSAVLTEAHRLAADAADAGFAVVRLKVEVDPNNVDVPVTDADPHPPETYFEHHAKLLRPSGADRTELLAVCERHAAHLSRNAFRDGGEVEERFVTLRNYGVGRVTALARMEQLLADLHALGETVVECESEFCVFDTNLNLDAGWLS
jgi:acetyl-CoA acetyltransferase